MGQLESPGHARNDHSQDGVVAGALSRERLGVGLEEVVFAVACPGERGNTDPDHEAPPGRLAVDHRNVIYWCTVGPGGLVLFSLSGPVVEGARA